MFFKTFVRRLSSLRQPLESEISGIRKQFSQLGDGSVDLSLNEETGVALVTLNNEERKNALSGKMMVQFSDVVHELNNWKKGKAVIIVGKNGFFSSGGDLNTVRRIADPLNGRKMSLLMHDSFTRLQSLPLISVALIQGMALGGGAEIATSCDLRVVSENSQIGFVHIRIGIVSAWGGGSRLVQLVGPRRALDLMLTGRRVKSEEALQIGLADCCLENLEQTQQFVRKYIHFSCESVRAVKRIVNSVRYLPLELCLEEELEQSVDCWGSKQHLIGLQNNVKHN